MADPAASGQQMLLETLPPPSRAVGLTLCGLAVALAASLSAWTRAHRSARIVRSGQPPFLHLLCGGCALMACAIVPLGIDRDVAPRRGCDAACGAVPWLLSGGFSLAVLALYTKTRRINTIFRNSARFRKVQVGVWESARPMMAMLGGNVLVLVLWTALSPLRWHEVVAAADRATGRPTALYGTCSSEHQVAYIVTLAVINVGAVALLVWEAHQARHTKGISAEYAESDYIFMALGCMALCYVINVPVLFTARESLATCKWYI